jgi:branched-chain amino acid aminotransferase
LAIKINKATSDRWASIDLSDIEFGNVFSDHMFHQRWRNGVWTEGGLAPHGKIQISPAALGLHYSQAVFEGLKAYRGTSDNVIRLFRPDKNAARLQASCDRLCIPQVSTEYFLEAISALVSLDKKWVPDNRSQSLYLRPILFGSEAHLSVRPARSYEFFIIAAPVSEYFDRAGPGISLRAEDHYTRAAPGGMGAAKTGGNYASTLRATEDGLEKGFDQILWLDSKRHCFIEEAGHMNIFFRIGEKVLTPALTGTILPGVTRDSIITLLDDWGVQTEEKKISIDELKNAMKSGELVEAFGAGTAAVVVPIRRIEHRSTSILIPNLDSNTLCNRLYDELTGIQYGEIADRYNWMTKIC